MKVKVKFAIIFIVFLVISIIIPQNLVNAGKTSVVEGTPGTDGTSVGSLVGTITPKDVNSTDYEGFQKTLGTILGFFQIASALTSVIMFAFLGFKMLLEPSPETKKDVREKFKPIILGIVVVFGATSIARFIIAAVE